VEVERYFEAKVRCRRADVEVGIRGLWRRAVGRRGGMEIVSSRGALQACERYFEAKVRCRRADVEVWSSGALQSNRVGVCLKRSGGAISVCGYGGREVLNGGGTPRACRLHRMELGSSGVALRACRCLPQELGRRDIGV